MRLPQFEQPLQGLEQQLAPNSLPGSGSYWLRSYPFCRRSLKDMRELS